MTRWLHPPELQRLREQDRFDPVVEGSRYGLPPDLALSIWERVCADATDSAGRCDIEQARRQFEELAVRIAARGGRLHFDVGRVTRVSAEIDGDLRGSRRTAQPGSRAPGRETLVAVEARRRMADDGLLAGKAPIVGEAAMSGKAAMIPNASALTTAGASRDGGIEPRRRVTPENADGPTEPKEIPDISAVAPAMAALQAPPRSDRATLRGGSVGDRMSQLFGGRTRVVPRDGEHVPQRPSAQPDGQHAALQSPAHGHDALPGADANRRTPLVTDVPAHLLAVPARSTPGIAVMRSAERAEVDPTAAELVARARRDGTSLDEGLRPQLEASLGASLGHVRVHTGGDADAAAHALGARAFAIGPDLFFRNGAYDPATREGQHLIAHEVVHAVQAPDATAASAEGLAVSQPGDPHEREADSFADQFVRTPERGDAKALITPAAKPARTDASAAQFVIHQRAAASVHLAREDAPDATSPAAAPTPGPHPGGPAPAAAPTPGPHPGGPAPAAAPTPGPHPGGPAPAAAPTPGPTPRPTLAPAPTPSPAPAATPAPTSAQAPSASPRPAVTPAPGASPTPGPAPTATPGASPTPAPVPSAGPGTTAGGSPAGASGDFAARIQTAVAAQRQAVSAKANEVKGTLATAFTGERQKLITGFDQLITRMEAARDKALADLGTRGEVARNRVRIAAVAEHLKLEQALGRQQQAVRQAGDTVAQAAIQQATAQGDRVQQGAASRATRARSIGSQWASKFEPLDGGTGTASDIRAKANDLASKLEGGASEGRQTCLDHGQKIATDLRKDAGDVATGMSDKLKDARSRIDKDRDDAIKSIDDGIQGAHDGITRSFAQTRQQVEQKKGDAGTGYDQLRAGALAQVDTGLGQVLGKLDTVGQQMQTDVSGMLEGARQYAVAPEVTAELNAGIGRTVAQHEARLGQLGTQGTSAFAGVQTEANAAATQQTSTILAGMDAALSGLQTSLNGKVDQSAAKIDEAATSAETAMQSITPKVEGDLSQGITKGQGEWNKQLTEKIGTLSGRVDTILSQQDSQLSKLDSDLGSQYADAKQKSEDAKRDKHWYESAWDSVKGAVSSAFEFVGGLIVGFFEAAWELLKGLWEMLKTPLGWLLLAIVVILAVIVVVLFGWEALIIAGIVIGLCMAAYYVYLAVTTPGLTPYERGKLFGKALFNVVLGFAGVEFEGTNLLRFTQWGGLIPQAIRLVQEVGSIGEAIQLVRLVGSIKTALQLVEALGSVERVMQLVQEVGSASKLVTLIERVGGVENLLRLIANPKIGDVGTLVRLLENAKIGNIATLERLLANAKIADVATLERLLGNAKITDAAALERLLGNAKIADVATLERLLGNAKIADAATLERLLGNAKIADVATLERLLGNAKIADAATLERLLNNAKIADVTTLERLLGNAKIADAATLERLLNNAKIPDVATLERLLGNAKVTDVGALERLLANAKLSSATDLERVLADAKVKDVENLADLLDSVDDLGQLERLLGDTKVPHGVPLAKALDACDQAARFERMLHSCGDLNQLWRLLRGTGKAGSAKLEEILDFVGTGNAGKVERMARVAGGDSHTFGEMVDLAKQLPHQPPPAPPIPAPPSEVAAFGFHGVDFLHVLEGHTWEYLNIALRNGKDTTLMPRGAAPGEVSRWLGEVLRGLNPPGTVPPKPIPWVPQAGSAGGISWQVGANDANEIGQFFPLSGVTIPWNKLEAIFDVLR